jgi:hypothetical protein
MVSMVTQVWVQLSYEKGAVAMLTQVWVQLSYENGAVAMVTQVWVQLSYENGAVAMVKNLNSSWLRTDWCTFRIYLRSLNASHFGMVEDRGLKIGAEVTLNSMTYLRN